MATDFTPNVDTGQVTDKVVPALLAMLEANHRTGDAGLTPDQVQALLVLLGRA